MRYHHKSQNQIFLKNSNFQFSHNRIVKFNLKQTNNRFAVVYVRHLVKLPTKRSALLKFKKSENIKKMYHNQYFYIIKIRFI